MSDVATRKIAPADKPQRLFDGGDLYLEVFPSGGKWWRWKYRFAGKEKRLSLGVYPETTLAEARARHAEARKVLSAGVDPGEQRKVRSLTKATANQYRLPRLSEGVGNYRSLSEGERTLITFLYFVELINGSAIAATTVPRTEKLWSSTIQFLVYPTTTCMRLPPSLSTTSSDREMMRLARFPVRRDQLFDTTLIDIHEQKQLELKRCLELGRQQELFAIARRASGRAGS